MKQIKYMVMIAIVMFVAYACSNAQTSKISEWAIPETEFPLAEPGPYYVGVQEITTKDESRGGREIEIKIWYPAKEKTDALSMFNAPAYKPDAPYPLIVTGYGGGGLFDKHLTTHGFVMIEVTPPEEYPYYDLGVIDHPRDLLFVLDQIASNPPNGLKGIVDTDQVGVAGYSWEGLYSLLVSGARIDPDFYQTQCANAKPGNPIPETWWIDHICHLSGMWGAFAEAAGSSTTTSTDGLWQPLTDSRIRAVMPMSPEGSWLLGARGLAAVDRPTMFIAGTKDVTNYYDLEAVYIFEHLGTAERYMVSFIDKDYFMVEEPETVRRINHFATAFLGYYLQGRTDYAEYFSEDFVAQYEDLAWGVYKP
jgi:predicted dienelactone hydrolase